jgi:hypothetical protein
LLPETAKKPAEFLVNVYPLVNTAPDASLTVRAPIVAPTGALVETVKLLMLTAMNFSALGENVLVSDLSPIVNLEMLFSQR